MPFSHFRLKFLGEQAPLEEIFRRHYFRINLSHHRFCCMISIIFLSSWSYINYLFYRDWQFIFDIVLAILILMFLFGLIISYTAQFKFYEQKLSFFYILVVASYFNFMIFLTDSIFLYPLIIGLIIIQIFNFTFIRLRFPYAFTAGILLLLETFTVVASQADNQLGGNLFLLYYTLIITNLLGIIINYSMEKIYRREFLLLHRIERDREESLSHMESKLHQDELTNLYNRKAMEDLLEKKIALCHAVEYPSALCFLDLDQLKYLNDNRGHDKGDAYIRLLGHSILKNIRDKDMAFRIGGDEFLLLLEQCDESTARIISERIQLDFAAIAKKELDIDQGSFCAGIISIKDHPEKRVGEMIALADKLMLEEKSRKRVRRGKLNPVN